MPLVVTEGGIQFQDVSLSTRTTTIKFCTTMT